MTRCINKLAIVPATTLRGAIVTTYSDRQTDRHTHKHTPTSAHAHTDTHPMNVKKQSYPAHAGFASHLQCTWDDFVTQLFHGLRLRGDRSNRLVKRRWEWEWGREGRRRERESGWVGGGRGKEGWKEGGLVVVWFRRVLNVTRVCQRTTTYAPCPAPGPKNFQRLWPSRDVIHPQRRVMETHRAV